MQISRLFSPASTPRASTLLVFASLPLFHVFLLKQKMLPADAGGQQKLAVSPTPNIRLIPAMTQILVVSMGLGDQTASTPLRGKCFLGLGGGRGITSGTQMISEPY